MVLGLNIAVRCPEDFFFDVLKFKFKMAKPKNDYNGFGYQSFLN